MMQTVWLILTYTYNAILVLFIATHLFVGATVSFITGMYMGVYLSQNYEIPRINEPRTVWEKFLAFLEKNRRNPQVVRMSNVLHPTTIKGLVVEPPPPSTTETILVSSSNGTATFTQRASQTEDIEDSIVDILDRSEATENTLTAESTSNPLADSNATTLILTEPEDLTMEYKSISSEQIVQASLILDKDKAISRSNTKLNC